METLGSFEIIEKAPQKYYQGIEELDENQMEITEEEFNSRRNAFIGTGEEELEWKALDGFLNGNRIFISCWGIRCQEFFWYRIIQTY